MESNLGEEKDLVSTDDELYWKLKFTLIVITVIIFVLIIFFALLYYCRQCSNTSPGVPSSPKTPQPSDNQLTEAPVMIFNNQIDISGYWNPEVNVENECESVQVQVHALESVEVANELNILPPAFEECPDNKKIFTVVAEMTRVPAEATEAIQDDTPTATEQHETAMIIR